MAKVYECTITTIVTVRIKADSEDQLQDWINTHDISDICEMADGYSINYEDEVICETGYPHNIDISEED